MLPGEAFEILLRTYQLELEPDTEPGNERNEDFSEISWPGLWRKTIPGIALAVVIIGAPVFVISSEFVRYVGDVEKVCHQPYPCRIRYIEHLFNAEVQFVEGG